MIRKMSGDRNPLAGDLQHVLDHTRDVWSVLQGARIFTTGGTGFFGCWLLESFAWACDRLVVDASMTVLTRSPEIFRRKAPHLAEHPAIRLIEGDICSFGFPRERFTHVIHGAAHASANLNREEPLAIMDTIVDGTRRALDFAVEAQAGRFLMISSGAVYGSQPPEMTHVAESYNGGPEVTDPRSVYGEAKRLAEQTCAVYADTHRLTCPIARGFGFVGPHLPLDTQFTIGKIIGDCLAGRDIEIRGDGRVYRSYLYAADLAIWLWTILARGQSRRAYNMGSERGLSTTELAEVVARELAPETAVRVTEQESRGAPERFVPETSRARKELGLCEWVTLEEGIRRTAMWARGGAK